MGTQALITESLQRFSITEQQLSEWEGLYLGIRVASHTDKDNHDTARAARLVLKGKRVEVEKLRKELKEDSLRFGRAVDAEAKRIASRIEAVEAHLQEQEDIVAKYKQRLEAAAKAKADQERAEQLARIAVAEEKAARERAAIQLEREELEREKEHQRQLDEVRRQAAAQAVFETEQRLKVKAAQPETLLSIVQRFCAHMAKTGIDPIQSGDTLQSLYFDALEALKATSD